MRWGMVISLILSFGELVLMMGLRPCNKGGRRGLTPRESLVDVTNCMKIEDAFPREGGDYGE